MPQQLCLTEKHTGATIEDTGILSLRHVRPQRSASPSAIEDDRAKPQLNKLRQKVERKTSQAVSGQVVGNKPHGPYGATLSLLAAYDVGRLLNQLSWNLQHAALLGKPEHYDQADAILIELQTQFRVFLLFQNFTERTAKEEHQK